MKLPRKITLKHHKAYVFLGKNGGDMTMEKVQLFLTLFFGVEHKRTIYGGDYNDVYKLFLKTVLLIDEQTRNPLAKPSKKITLGGVDFKLIDISKPSIGWLIDSSIVNADTPPYILASLGYCPADSYYGETDEHGNLLHPMSELQPVFDSEMLLVDYLRLNAFFLTNLNFLVKQYTVQKWFERQMKVWGRLFGKFKRAGLNMQ
jgi:hypothetical protein